MTRGRNIVCVLLGFIFFDTNIVVECITCLNCQNIMDLSSCMDAVVCKEDEVCYIEKVLSQATFKPLYNTGCRKLEFCKLELCNKKAYGDSSSRRKRAIGDDLTLCSQCCYEDSCNAEGCGYKHPQNNNTKCFSCKEVYKGGPPCTQTQDCDLKYFACSVTNSIGSIHPGAYELGCKFKRRQCNVYLSLSAGQKDENVKCCDKTLCNVSPYNRKVNKSAIAIDFECPTGIVRPLTTPATTSTVAAATTTTATTSTSTVTTRAAVVTTTTTTTTPSTTTTTTTPSTTATTTTTPSTTTPSTTTTPTTATTTTTVTTTTTTSATTTTPTTTTPTTTTSATTTTPTTTVTTATTTKTSASTSTTTAKTTAAATTTTATTKVRYPNKCSFDQNNLCSWTQGSTDDFDWTIQSGPTQTSDTGPPADHTVGNAQGKYLYIESSAPNNQGEFARFESPTLSTNRKTCLSLWYYMYGDGIGNLTILLHKSQNSNSETVLFNISGDQGPRWCPAAIEITTSPVVYNYKLVIQGDVGVTYRGDIAIDDLLISDTNCTVTKCNKSDVSASIVG